MILSPQIVAALQGLDHIWDPPTPVPSTQHMQSRCPVLVQQKKERITLDWGVKGADGKEFRVFNS